MEKMKMGIGTMATLVLVAVAVSALVLSFGMVQATEDKVKKSFDLELKQNGPDVDVKVKAKGLEPNVIFTVRAYDPETDCGTGPAVVIGFENSGGNGNIAISGTISDRDVDTVESVSIRSPNGGPGILVQCFLNTTP